MTANAHAVVLHAAGDVRVEERAVASPGSGEVLVRVLLGGICGSDISYFAKGAVGRFQVLQPMILGHEIIGIVGDVGSDVVGLDDGQRIAVDPSSPCMRCDRCLEGRFNICMNPSFLGSASTQPHTDGGFASLVLSRVANVVPLDRGVADEAAVFAEPLSVCVHALERAGGVRGADVLIIGAGPIGGMLTALCAHEDAARVVVADLEAHRLETARSVGAHEVRLVGHDDLGDGYDVVFDASGAAPAIADALERVRRGGVFVLVGLPHGGPVPMPVGLSVTGEVDIRGSFRFNHSEFRRSLELLSGGLDLRPLVSSRHSSHAAHDALVEAASGRSMKVHLDFTDIREDS